MAMLYCFDEAVHTKTFGEALGMMVVEAILQFLARSTFVLKDKVMRS
jgi:peroxiredoxin